MNKKLQKIALTGATSMIGLALIKQCIQNGIEVLAFVRPNSFKLNRLPDSNLITIVNCGLDELTDFKPTETEMADVFYHFAWEHTDKSGRCDCDKQLKNVSHTLSAVRLAKRMSCKKFIGAGSQAEYGRTSNPLTGVTPVNPENAYGIAKYAAGKFAVQECKKLNMENVWVRILSVYGANDNDNTLLKDFIVNCQKNNAMPLGPCTHIWDYLHEDDAGCAFLAIGNKGMDGKTYCLGSGMGKPLKEYLEKIKNIINPEYIPQYDSIPYNGNSLQYLCADISDLTKDTGWEPMISFEEGIRKTINCQQ